HSIIVALYLMKEKKVQAIIGPQQSEQAKFVINLGEKAQVPIVSFSATSPSLSPTKNSYFVRTALDDRFQVNATASIFEAYGWKEVALIYEDTEYGNGLVHYFSDAFQQINVLIPYRCVIPLTATDDQILEKLYKLMTMKTRVFLVHMTTSIGSRLFNNARNARMMDHGYAWITTSGLSSLLDHIDSQAIDSMQGVLGVQPYIQSSKQLEDFKLRCGENASTDLSTLGYSEMGPKFRKTIRSTRLKGGLSGDLNLITGQRKPSAFQILNVIGKQRVIGFWTAAKGLSQNLNATDKSMYSASADDLETPIWPGYSTTTPKGWVIPTKGKKLRIGVPVKKGFNQFVKIEVNPKSNETTFTGYSIDVFKAVIDELSFALPYDFFPYPDPIIEGPVNYDELIYQVYLKKFDAVVGDTTIIANRSLYVDFTLPYLESGVSMMVLVKDDKRKNAWVFLKPLSWELWLTTGVAFLFTGIVVWILEHRINTDFRGPPTKQLGVIFSFAFSTLVFSQRERVMNNLSRFVMIIWVFVVLILQTTYTASLTSMLTVERLRPMVTDIEEIRNNGYHVGYHNGSFVKDLLINRLKLDPNQLRAYDTEDEYHEALSKGTSKGGVAAIFDGIPHLKVFLSNHCSKYKIVGPIYRTDGLGFVFPLGCPLVSDISRAILNVTQGGRIEGIEKSWFKQKTKCGDLNAEGSSTSSSISLQSFMGLFLITGLASGFSLLIHLLQFSYDYWNHPITTTTTESVRHKFLNMMKHFDQKDLSSHTFKSTSSRVHPVGAEFREIEITPDVHCSQSSPSISRQTDGDIVQDGEEEDTQSEPTESVDMETSISLDLLKNIEVQAIIGPETSSQANFMIDLGDEAQVPIISFSATSPSLSSAQTPYFVRASLSDSSQVKAIASIFQSFGWKEAVLIYESTDYGNGRKLGIATAFDEIPYMKLFLSNYCDKCTMVGPTYKADGFSFAFPRGSPLVPNVSRAVLNVTEGGKMARIEQAWFGQDNCPDSGTKVSSYSLTLDSFGGVFIITGAASLLALFILLLRFCHSNEVVIKHDDANASTLKRIVEMAKKYDEMDPFSHDSRFAVNLKMELDSRLLLMGERILPLQANKSFASIVGSDTEASEKGASPENPIPKSYANVVGNSPSVVDDLSDPVHAEDFTKVLVEMEVAAPRPEEIQVERRQPGTANLFFFKQQLIYKDSLGICGFCKKRGHQLNDCREKKAYDERQNTLDKTGILGPVYGEDRVNSIMSNSPGRAMPFLERDDHNISNSNLNLNIASHISPSAERGETGVSTPINDVSRLPNVEEGEILIETNPQSILHTSGNLGLDHVGEESIKEASLGEKV
ncbi:glutamate receptor 2.9-like, partial [Macadamia integrifolia]|uniref:glutamate receptor 2.9-like n=1 Tax=Macadamia integrifolia TaxID=60698 RepID=UPI001C4F01C0